jgi:hypothetical protein
MRQNLAVMGGDDVDGLLQVEGVDRHIAMACLLFCRREALHA